MPSSADDRVRLLHGPYQAPALRVGDRATCLYRGDVIITSCTDALISWPRCKRAGGGKGRPTLLVTEELARAIRTESALAVGYWWGASKDLVRNWRAALGVTNEANVGSRRVIRLAAQKGGDAVHEAAARRRKRYGALPRSAAEYWRPHDRRD
jgi:hypothetical protein